MISIGKEINSWRNIQKSTSTSLMNVKKKTEFFEESSSERLLFMKTNNL